MDAGTAKRLYEDEKRSIAQIAKAGGITTRQALRLLKEAGVSMRAPGRAPDALRLRAAADLVVASRWSVEDAAEVLDVTAQTVERAVREARARGTVEKLRPLARR